MTGFTKFAAALGAAVDAADAQQKAEQRAAFFANPTGYMLKRALFMVKRAEANFRYAAGQQNSEGAGAAFMRKERAERCAEYLKARKAR